MLLKISGRETASQRFQMSIKSAYGSTGPLTTVLTDSVLVDDRLGTETHVQSLVNCVYLQGSYWDSNV